MMRKVQTGRLGAAFFAAICAIGSALGLSAQTYYWTGAANDGNQTATAANWSLTDGGPASSKAPGQGDTAVFNNAEALTLTKSGQLHYLKYEFRGANVTLSQQIKQYGYGGGGITATGSGVYTFGYPLELNASQFAGEDKTFVVDVDERAKVVVQSSGTTKIFSPAVFVKRGGGTYMTTQFLETKAATTQRGDLVFEAGTLTTERPQDRNNCFGGFVVTGSATKEFVQDAMNVLVTRYEETVEASQTMDFHMIAGDKKVLLECSDDVSRFSANVRADTYSSNELEWKPTTDKTLTMVDRVWDTTRGKFLVSAGTMKFAEGAGIKNSGGFTVKAGANVTIAASASGDFSGADIVLEAGATLTVEGGDHYFRPKSVTYDGTKVADGVYSAGAPTWLKGTGHLWVGSATRPDLTLLWTGGAGEASPKLATAANWRCEDGSPVAALQATDSLVLNNNDSDVTVSDSFTIGTGRTFTKRGVGTFQCAKYLPADVAARGRFVFEAGTLKTQRSDPRVNNFGEVVVTGPAEKMFYMSAMGLSIVKYVEDESASQTLTFYNYEGNANTYFIELCGAYDVPRFSANIWSSYGDYTLKWNPGAANTITMVDHTWYTTSGRFLVSTGTMRFADGAGISALKSFTVASGAKVEIAANAGSFVGAFTLSLESGATLKLEGDKTISAVTYGGAAVADGVYTADDFDWLEGEGRLVVGSGSPTETVEATWTGNGDGTTITDPANWGAAGSTELPDFASGSLVATFPANATVTVPSGATWKFKGVVVDPNGAEGSLLTITGAGEMWIGSAGFVSRGVGGVTINVKTAVLSSTPWVYGSAKGGGSFVFDTSAEVETIGDAVWTVLMGFDSYGASSNGPFLQLKCSNPDLGDTSFKMPVQVSADAALGGPDSVATIDCLAKANLALELFNCHLLNRRIVLNNIQAPDYLKALGAKGTVTLDGELYFHAPNDYYWSLSPTTTAANAVFTVRGGWRTSYSDNLTRFGRPFDANCNVAVENGLVANKFWLVKAGNFVVSGEIDVNGGLFIADGAALRLNDDVSFKQSTTAQVVAGVGFTGTAGTGTLDLGGHDVTLQILSGEGAGIVTSDAAATLTLNADTTYVTPHWRGWEAAPTFNAKIGSGTSAPDREVAVADIQQTDRASFQGAASLVKSGSLPHWLGGVSSSTGTVEVTEGVLTFKDGARWRTTPSVTVSGTGVLGVDGNKVFSSATDLVVDGEATDRIRIAAGKKAIVGSLTVNGVRQGEVPAGLVTGGGTLQIGPDGMTVIVR